MGDFYSCLQLTGVDGIMVSGSPLLPPGLPDDLPSHRGHPGGPRLLLSAHPPHLLHRPSQVSPRWTSCRSDPSPHGYLDLPDPIPTRSGVSLFLPTLSSASRPHRPLPSHEVLVSVPASPCRLLSLPPRSYFSKHPEIRNRLGNAGTMEEYELICQVGSLLPLPVSHLPPPPPAPTGSRDNPRGTRRQRVR
jgi:hypothetical protein